MTNTRHFWLPLVAILSAQACAGDTNPVRDEVPIDDDRLQDAAVPRIGGRPKDVAESTAPNITQPPPNRDDLERQPPDGGASRDDIDARDPGRSRPDGPVPTTPDVAAQTPVAATPCPNGAGLKSELCEGFEGDGLNTTLWRTQGPSRIHVDTSKAHTGKSALHFTLTPGGQSTSFIRQTATFPAATFYLRFFIFISPGLPPGNTHEAFVVANSATGAATELGFGGKKELVTNHFLGAGEHPVGANSPFPTNRWVCVEFANEAGPAAGRLVIKAFIDGKEIPELRQSSPNGTPFESVSIGPQQYHPIPVLSDIWIDDLHVSAKPVGCDP